MWIVKIYDGFGKHIGYNRKYNNEPTVPDYYIAAQDPVKRPDTFKCTYRVRDL